MYNQNNKMFMPPQAFGASLPSFPQQPQRPQLSMPTQAQGSPMGVPFTGQMPQHPQMPQGAMPNAPAGQGILSGGAQFPQAPQMKMPPQQLMQILQLLSQRR